MPDKYIHIITDAAGSLTAEDAASHGFTLLQSIVNIGGRSAHEGDIDRGFVYSSMRSGVKASTAQPSIEERYMKYSEALKKFGRVLYLCVGSVYTGNYRASLEWKKDGDPEDNFRVIDTGYASGRLAVVVLKTVQFSKMEIGWDAVLNYASSAINKAEEYIFLDKLQYLAAGGRLSKTSAFFGDMLRMKPVISPRPDGAGKSGVVRTQAEQISFALARLSASVPEKGSPFIMLEYTDNREWVEDKVLKRIRELYPDAEIMFQPLSLTTGVHTGPGSWGMAFLPAKI